MSVAIALVKISGKEVLRRRRHYLLLNNDDDVVANKNQVLLIQTPLTNVKMPIDLFKQFSDYLKLKYEKNEEIIIKNEQDEFNKVFSLGLIQSRKYLSSETTLLHKDRKPRKDVLIKLGLIATEFLRSSDYPKYPASELWTVLNKALGDCDYRVKTDYKKTVLLYCNINENIIDRCTNYKALGELDVSGFVKLIPKKYISDFSPINTTSSTSLSELQTEKMQ